MNKTLLVLKNELTTTIKRKSFLVTLFLIPLVGSLVVFFIGNSQKSTDPSALTNIFISPPKEFQYGIFDASNTLKQLPEWAGDTFRMYATESAAQAALEQGEIGGYYLINADYIESGKVILRKTELDLMGDDPNWQLESLLNTQLLEDNPQLLARIENPLNFSTEIQSSQVQRDPESMLTFYVPYIITMIFYFVILSSASLMLTSITNEKSNRVIEILMTSITPTQMLTGKIIALGIAGLLQTVVWTGTGLLLLRLSGRQLELASSVQLPISILLWGIAFFISGYFLYASLMAGAGALVPNLKEASQATTVLIIPLIIPLILISAIVEKPNGTLATIFSLFPLTSPVTMMTRLAAGSVPIWQLLLSIALILITAVLVIRSVANFFRAQTLLSGQEFKIKYLFKALLGNYS